MGQHNDGADDGQVLNIVQLVLINFVFFVGLVVYLRVNGTSWGASVGLAWIGGAAITCATAVVFEFLFRPKTGKAYPPQIRQKISPDLVDPLITDAVRVWEEDRLAEKSFAIGHAVSDPSRKPRRAGMVTMQRMWNEDAEADAVVPERPVRPDRRQRQDPSFPAEKDRRVNKR